MVGDVAHVVGVREFDVEGYSEVAFVVVLLICVVITVAVVADLGTGPHPSCVVIIDI